MQRRVESSDSDVASIAAADAVVVTSSDNDEDGEPNDVYPDNDEHDELEGLTTEEKVATWIVKFRPTRNSSDYVIKVINSLLERGQKIRKDTRTILKTPRVVPTERKCGGNYAYWGVTHGINRILDRHVDYRPDELHLSVNVDGLLLFKASNSQLWPILVKFGHFNPFIVCIFHGNTKPHPLDEYLEDFLNELGDLIHNGLMRNRRRIRVHVKCFICDAPARAFLKCIKGHTGFYACERCDVRGYRRAGRTVFNFNALGNPRTEERFANFEYHPWHQHARSPLVDIGISCVAQFVLDMMHLVFLGIVRRMLCFLLNKGARGVKLSARERRQLSEALSTLSGLMPSEFVRQPRGTDDVSLWKATEYRQFLLYTGPVVLKDIVRADVYDHFLRLHVGITLLSEPNDGKRNRYLAYARQLLLTFVQDCKHVYGREFTVYNIHMLAHIADDVEYYGCSLNDITAFPFENHLNKIKRLVRQFNNPIAQVGKRLEEIRVARGDSYKSTSIRRIITNKMKDSCFLIRNGDYAFVTEVLEGGEYVCDIVRSARLHSLYRVPCDSKIMNIGCIRNVRAPANIAETRVLQRNDFKKKVVILPRPGLDGEVALIPMTHGYEPRQGDL